MKLRNETVGQLAPSVTKAMMVSSDWLVWQLADSAFPTGGFAHSGGLEATWQHGEIRNRSDLAGYLTACLNQLGHAVLPFVTAAHRQPEKLSEHDRLCDAFTTNHVANRASRLQGRAFLASAECIFSSVSSRRDWSYQVQGEGEGSIDLNGYQLAFSDTNEELRLPCCHFAPVFGAITRRLGIPGETAKRLFFFNHLRSLLAAAVRLGVTGPLKAQSLQHCLAPKAEEILARCESLTLDDLAQTAPLHDLWQGTQDRLYSRLFQS